jgi:hypothetical protein
MPLTAAQIEERLERIEADLAERQGAFEKAAADKHRLAREFELRHARAFIAASGDTATERKANATVTLAAAEDGLWAKVQEAEGKYEGLKAAMRALETRATIGMSLLKIHAREVTRVPEPERWDRRAA